MCKFLKIFKPSNNKYNIYKYNKPARVINFRVCTGENVIY